MSDGHRKLAAVEPPDKADAVIQFIHSETSKGDRTRASYRRVQKALADLGLSPDEANKVLHWIGYHDEHGNPRAWCAPKKPNP